MNRDGLDYWLLHMDNLKLGEDKNKDNSKDLEGYLQAILKKIPGGGSGGDAVLTDDITPNLNVGGVKAGITLPAGSTMQELFEILTVEYQKPTVTFSISPSTTLYEKGTTISNLNLSATAYKKSEKIIGISFYQNSILLQSITDGVENGGTFTCSKSITSFNTDTTFKVAVIDENDSTVTTTKTIEFVSPFYYGSVNSVAELTNLTKDLSKKENKTYTYTANNKYLCIFYPSSYGTLKSIKDSNNFENINNFTTNTITIAGEAYRYYMTTETKTVSNFKFTFSF